MKTSCAQRLTMFELLKIFKMNSHFYAWLCNLHSCDWRCVHCQKRIKWTIRDLGRPHTERQDRLIMIHAVDLMVSSKQQWEWVAPPFVDFYFEFLVVNLYPIASVFYCEYFAVCLDEIGGKLRKLEQKKKHLSRYKIRGMWCLGALIVNCNWCHKTYFSRLATAILTRKLQMWY